MGVFTFFAVLAWATIVLTEGVLKFGRRMTISGGETVAQVILFTLLLVGVIVNANDSGWHYWWLVIYYSVNLVLAPVARAMVAKTPAYYDAPYMTFVTITQSLCIYSGVVVLL